MSLPTAGLASLVKIKNGRKAKKVPHPEARFRQEVLSMERERGHFACSRSYLFPFHRDRGRTAWWHHHTAQTGSPSNACSRTSNGTDKPILPANGDLMKVELPVMSWVQGPGMKIQALAKQLNSSCWHICKLPVLTPPPTCRESCLFGTRLWKFSRWTEQQNRLNRLSMYNDSHAHEIKIIKTWDLWGFSIFFLFAVIRVNVSLMEYSNKYVSCCQLSFHLKNYL